MLYNQRFKPQKLKKYAKVQGGYAFKSSEYTESGIPIVRIGDLKNNTVDIENCVKVSNSYLDTCKNFIIKDNELLIAMTGATVGKVAFVKNFKTHLLLNQRVGKFICDSAKIDSKYLYYVTSAQEFYNEVQILATGAGQPNISPMQIENINIPVPDSIEEQQEIVQVLDTMSDIIRLREECISHAQDLIPALFQEMFDNPQTNKKNWQICCLKDLAKIDRQNISPEELKTKQYTYIGLEHIEKETGRILVDPNSQQDINLKSNKFFFTNNHVLYGKLRPYLNKVALPDFDGVCSTDIFPLLPLEGISNKYFLKVLMNTSYFVNMANSQSSGANLPRIGTTALENIKVFKPDYTLQEQFAQKAIEIEAYIKEQQEELESAKQMFQSLLHHAFTGELTNNKPQGDTLEK